jgi:hypothetical protein
MSRVPGDDHVGRVNDQWNFESKPLNRSCDRADSLLRNSSWVSLVLADRLDWNHLDLHLPTSLSKASLTSVRHTNPDLARPTPAKPARAMASPA